MTVIKLDLKKIGKLISKLRKERGITQNELGNRLGISGKAVSKWERGISLPDISLLNQLSEILGITITELLIGEKKKKEKNIKIIIKVIIVMLATICTIGSYIIMSEYCSYNIYDIKSKNKKYYIDGILITSKNCNQLIIYNINFKDKNIVNNSSIYNIELKLLSHNKIISTKQLYIKKDKEIYNLFINIDEKKQYNEEIITSEDIKKIKIAVKITDYNEKYIEYTIPLKFIKKN